MRLCIAVLRPLDVELPVCHQAVPEVIPEEVHFVCLNLQWEILPFVRVVEPVFVAGFSVVPTTLGLHFPVLHSDQQNLVVARSLPPYLD